MKQVDIKGFERYQITDDGKTGYWFGKKFSEEHRKKVI